MSGGNGGRRSDFESGFSNGGSGAGGGVYAANGRVVVNNVVVESIRPSVAGEEEGGEEQEQHKLFGGGIYLNGGSLDADGRQPSPAIWPQEVVEAGCFSQHPETAMEDQPKAAGSM